MSTAPLLTAPTTVTVPVSNPAHPSHKAWLEILLAVLRAAVVIGPAVVAITSPANAAEAQQLGQLGGLVTSQFPQM